MQIKNILLAALAVSTLLELFNIMTDYDNLISVLNKYLCCAEADSSASSGYEYISVHENTSIFIIS